MTFDHFRRSSELADAPAIVKLASAFDTAAPHSERGPSWCNGKATQWYKDLKKLTDLVHSRQPSAIVIVQYGYAVSNLLHSIIGHFESDMDALLLEHDVSCRSQIEHILKHSKDLAASGKLGLPFLTDHAIAFLVAVFLGGPIILCAVIGCTMDSARICAVYIAVASLLTFFYDISLRQTSILTSTHQPFLVVHWDAQYMAWHLSGAVFTMVGGWATFAGLKDMANKFLGKEKSTLLFGETENEMQERISSERHQIMCEEIQKLQGVFDGVLHKMDKMNDLEDQKEGASDAKEIAEIEKQQDALRTQLTPQYKELLKQTAATPQPADVLLGYGEGVLEQVLEHARKACNDVPSANDSVNTKQKTPEKMQYSLFKTTPGSSLNWNEFRGSIKGQGYTQAQISEMYQAQKSPVALSVPSSPPGSKKAPSMIPSTPPKRKAACSNLIPSTSFGPLKNDGTPDMRYKVNKELHGSSHPHTPSYSTPRSTSRSTSSQSPSGPLKNDGTPDMRYKVNKELHGSSHTPSYSAPRSTSRSTSSQSPSGPLKKDGTPDMRYKANRR